MWPKYLQVSAVEKYGMTGKTNKRKYNKQTNKQTTPPKTTIYLGEGGHFSPSRVCAVLRLALN